MKKTMYKTLLLLAAVLPTACTTDQEPLAEVTPEVGSAPFVVTATMPTGEADTRVQFTEDQTTTPWKLGIAWKTSGEEIAVNQGGATNTWTVFEQDGAADASGSVQFKNDGFTPTAATYYANYPAGFTGTPVTGYSLTANGMSYYDNSLLYMYAKATYTEGSPLNFAFKHLASVMSINIKVSKALIEKITGFAVTATSGLVTGVKAYVTGDDVVYTDYVCDAAGITGTTDFTVPSSADATFLLVLRVLPCESGKPVKGLTVTLTGTRSGADVTLTAPVTTSDLQIAAGQWYYTKTAITTKTSEMHVATPGTLTDEQIAAAVTSDGDLKLTGTPNEADLKKIADWSKNNNPKIKRIDLSETTLTTMPKGLGGLNTLERVILPQNVTAIAEYAFEACTKLGTVVNLERVETIGAYAFSTCHNLAYINLTSATSIGDYAFANCIILNSITPPNSATSIGRRAFGNCYELKNVNLQKVTSIGDEAFLGCTSLETVTTGATSLGDAIFSGCSSLTSVTLTATTFVSVNQTALLSIGATNATLTLYSGTVSAGRWAPVGVTNDVNVSCFTNIIVN